LLNQVGISNYFTNYVLNSSLVGSNLRYPLHLWYYKLRRCMPIPADRIPNSNPQIHTRARTHTHAHTSHRVGSFFKS